MPYKNKEDYLAWKKRYYQANKEKWRDYEKTHREQINSKRREYYRKNAEKIREYKRKWEAEHKGRKQVYNERYYSSERGKATRKKYYEEHKQEFFERTKRSMEKYPVERKIRAMTDHAIVKGKIVRQPCEICGNPETDAHHDDYNKPLEVRWLCRSCHKKWHDNNKPIRAEDTWQPKEV